jgi:hypothetical protein
VALAGALVSALVTWWSVGVYLPTLNTPHTSLEGVPHPPSAVPTTPALARRLSLVVVDGLSFDAARATGELLPLRRRGVFRSLAVDFPSYTSPALVSLVTGLAPRDSGTRRNGNLGGVMGLDSILRSAAGAGVPVTLFARGFEDFAAILAAPQGTALYGGRFAPAVDLVRRGLSPSPARAFDLVHWGEVDDMGHRHGGASDAYRREAANASAYLVRYAAGLDPDQDVLVVVSDHGHLPEGGHGGDEPEVSHAMFLGLGGPFRHGVELGERPMRDVASTLAVLGGLRVPSSNLGLPMLDALEADDAATSFLLAGPFDEAAGFLCRLREAARCAEVGALVTRLRKADAAAWEEAWALHAELYQARARALDARRAARAPVRLGAALVLVALAAVAGLRELRRRRIRILGGLAWPAVLVPFLLAGAYGAALWLRGYRPTFSHMLPIPRFAADATLAGAVAVAAVALLARCLRLGRHAPWLLLSAIAVPWLLLSAWVGADPVTPPPNAAGVLVFLLGPAVPAAVVAATAIAWLEGRPARAR